MACDGPERGLIFPDNDILTPRNGTVAVAVRHDERPALFDQLHEIGIVLLGARQDDLALVSRLFIRFAGLKILGDLTELVDDQVLRTYLRDELNDGKFRTGDRRTVQLSVASDLPDQPAHLVVLADRGQKCLVRGIDPEMLLELVKNMGPELFFVVVDGVLVLLKRNIREFAEEIRILDDIHELQVLLEPARDRTGLRRHLRVQEIKAALECAL